MTADSVVTGDVKKSGHSLEKGYGGDERASARDKFALRRRTGRDDTTTDMETSPVWEFDRRCAR